MLSRQALPFCLLLVLLCRSAATTCAQQVPTLRAESHLVDSTISVHDADGKFVPDLSREELTIQEDGVPQTVRFFTRADQQPLSIGLLLDVSGSQERFLKEHERDVQNFLNQTILPQDRAFLLCFGNHLRLVSDWSASVPNVVAALHTFNKGERTFPELGPVEDRELGTALYDATYFAITERMQPIHGQTRLLVIFSDGEENSSEHDLLDAIAAAQNNNVLVYAVRYTDAKLGKLTARDRYGIRVLDHLAQQTGGKVFDARATSVKQAFAEIAADARSLYTVAYQSTNHEHDGQFRKVTIRSTRTGVTVRTRAGYYAHSTPPATE